MKTVGLVAAACVLLALTAGCGVDAMNSASATGLSRTPTTTMRGEPAAKVTDGPAKFGDRLPAGESLVVGVSAPKSFVPSETAYPHAPRAVAFEISIENQGTRPYRPSQLMIKAVTADGRTAVQVVDTPQGYTGVAGTGADVPPGKSVRLTIAFAVPADQVDLRVMVQPDASVAAMLAEFAGTA